MKNTLTDLHNHLFATLEALQDPDTPMEIERGRAIADVAKVLVDSARAEVDFLKVTGQTKGTRFFPEPAPAPSRPQLAAGGRVGAPEPTPLRRCAACEVPTTEDPCHRCGARWERAS